MAPSFAATSRRLADLQTEWGRVQAASSLLSEGPLDDLHGWVANAALSAGASELNTGMEDILAGLLAMIDGRVPTDERSHQEIFDAASIALPGLRPSLISGPVYDQLTAPTGFRHFERHSYRFRFNANRFAATRQ